MLSFPRRPSEDLKLEGSRKKEKSVFLWWAQPPWAKLPETPRQPHPFFRLSLSLAPLQFSYEDLLSQYSQSSYNCPCTNEVLSKLWPYLANVCHWARLAHGVLQRTSQGCRREVILQETGQKRQGLDMALGEGNGWREGCPGHWSIQHSP